MKILSTFSVSNARITERGSEPPHEAATKGTT
jgi:hypothetical protein